ncbi:hypothetical protein L210DRAFT_953145 [Boletus edulis BED1]|uniref:Uncharacterized protein n=1 Tax=Boletus edulis BED1 TaxID=1328754 RepID=A0AAD4G9Z7_BOLED|nr:hypothetical protein L210DRAFT_953145 [Boletus edulis BED1]
MTRVIARARFYRVTLGTDDSALPGQREDVWAGCPHGIEERVEVEIIGQHGLHVFH